jgi:hypothetical protein
MVVEWYCQLMGSELGPFSSVQLVDMARCHRVSPEDLVKRGKAGEWVPAYRVKGLFEAASKPTPVKKEPMTSSGATTAEAMVRPYEEALRRRVDPPVTREEWFCISSGKKLGPMSFENLQEKATNGELKATDRVWSSSAPKWSEAGHIHGLAVLFRSVAG